MAPVSSCFTYSLNIILGLAGWFRAATTPYMARLGLAVGTIAQNSIILTGMPTRLKTEIIAAAIAGFEEQKKRLNAQIAELRQMLNPSATDGSAPTPVRRRMSAAARARIAAAQRKRWAESRKQSERVHRPRLLERSGNLARPDARRSSRPRSGVGRHSGRRGKWLRFLSTNLPAS